MKPLEMIAEWRKGCSCGGPVLDRIEGDAPGTHSPAECVECTTALVDALAGVLHQPNEDMVEASIVALADYDEHSDRREVVRNILQRAL